jgi:hypothetical protein
LALVPEYRVYYVGESGHFVGRQEMTCRSDDVALERAKQLANGCAVELWEGGQLIARIDGSEFPPQSN